MPKKKTQQGGDAFRANANVVKLSASKRSSSRNANKLSSVVYLSHVPHGFYEEQMNGFFSQFGEVETLRLARSKKTTRSKGYAYVALPCSWHDWFVCWCCTPNVPGPCNDVSDVHTANAAVACFL